MSSVPPPHTLKELGEIDQLFMRAESILGEARNNLKVFNCDLAIRRSQEAFELYLKSLFRFLKREYPASHDLEKQIYELSRVLGEFQIAPQQVARLVLANAILNLWRSSAFYGDERLKVANLFNVQEAELALSYAQMGQLICNIVRTDLYRQSAAT
jgi:HEPN domain-containing protein